MTDEGAATEAAASNNGAGELDPTQIDANELAKNMSQATDEQLAELMSGPMRGQILGRSSGGWSSTSAPTPHATPRP